MSVCVYNVCVLVHVCTLIVHVCAHMSLLQHVTNQELFKKHVYYQSSHYEKYEGAMRPNYCLKLINVTQSVL